MPDSTPPGRELLARHFRQLREMGSGPLLLSGMTRREVLEWFRQLERQDALPMPSQGASLGSGVPSAAMPGSDKGWFQATVTTPPRPQAQPRFQSDGPRPPLPSTHDALREISLACTRCPLHEGRTQVVFSDGSPTASLMVVGEAPGANEDRTGLPFVGAAGKLLDLLLASVGLSREESVYICNVLKCRPPGNRDPQPAEIRECSPYLLKQVELVAPRAILAVGSFSGRLLTGQDSAPLSRLRGVVHRYEGVPLVVTYHPAALLRNRSWTRETWDDLQLLREVLDAA